MGNPTRSQIDIYRLHRDTCLALGIPQAVLISRQPEGTVTPAATNPRNAIYRLRTGVRTEDDTAEWPRTLIWLMWKAQELKAGAKEAADTSAANQWVMRGQGQCPVIDDAGDPVNMKDEDWVIEGVTGDRLRIDNPVPDAGGGWWTFELLSAR